MKASILLALFLGVIFAQMIPARLAESSDDDDSDDADTDDSGEEDSSDEEESDDDDDDDGPALTCLLFEEDFGCNTECAVIASAFSTKASGKCNDKSTCQCNLEQDKSLEALFAAKFDAEDDALKKIKKDKKLAKKVLDILRVPFQTAKQTKEQLKKVVTPAIYKQLTITDESLATTLVKNNGDLNQAKIKEYVAKKLKPVLKSSSKELKNTKYETNLKAGLKGKSDENLQSIVHEVRRTKNEKLSDIIDAYLKSKKIKEKPSTDKKDSLADAMGYLIIDTFVKQIDNDKPAAKKPARKSSSAKTTTPKKKSKKDDDDDDEKPRKKNQSKKPTSSGKKSPSKKPTKKTSLGRFELPNIDKNFINDYGGSSMSESFTGKNYLLQYSKSSGGSYNFIWKKGSDKVDMSISSGGSISQNWQLDGAYIQLTSSSGGSISQTWDFGNTRYIYSKSSGGSMSRTWTNGKRDLKALKKYQDLINQWCKENSYLMAERKDCVIY